MKVDTNDKIQHWEMESRNKTEGGTQKVENTFLSPFKHFQILPRYIHNENRIFIEPHNFFCC